MAVLVMKTAKVRESDDLSSLLTLAEARLRALLVQREMGACRVVVSEAQQPLKWRRARLRNRPARVESRGTRVVLIPRTLLARDAESQ